MSERTCPACGYPVPLTTGIGPDMEGVVPHDGAVSICIACGAIAIFTADGAALRAATPEEKAEIITDVKVANVVAAVLLLKGRDPAWPVGPRSPRR